MGKSPSLFLQVTVYECHLAHPCCVLQFNLNIDEVAVASQVFDQWRKDTAIPACIEVWYYVS